MGKNTLSFLKELGHRVRRCTGEANTEGQRGNTASVLGSVGFQPGLEDQF